MKAAIMQPYFFPYIGYFQLMNAVDEFVVYDNIEFTKKGWINRNRILVNGSDAFITLPLKKDSDFLHVKDRYLAETWEADKKKMLNRIRESYRKAPYFNEAFSTIEACILYPDTNLFRFIFNSLNELKKYLEINTNLIISSGIPANHELKSEQKVLAICKELNATTYINPIGGTSLYDAERFRQEGISLHFLKSDTISYIQFENEFVPWLSIIDVMMFNNKEEVQSLLNNKYTLQ